MNSIIMIIIFFFQIIIIQQRQRIIVRQWDSFKAKSMEFSRVIDRDDYLVAGQSTALSLKNNMLMTRARILCRADARVVSAA